MLKKIFVIFIFLIFTLSGAVAGEDENNITLTSDTMKYDIEAGKFVADGNVTIKGRGLVLTAAHGEGLVEKQLFSLSGNILINGVWQGDNVNLKAASATASMSNPTVYTLESGIVGNVGKVFVDCRYLQMVGEDLVARVVRRLEDTKSGLTFTGDNARAKISNGALVQVEASGNIVVKGVPGKMGDIAELRGSKALYSLARGTVVMTGGVTAVQKRRTLRADTLIYFPKTNRIEAIGNPRVTINVEDENLNATKKKK